MRTIGLLGGMSAESTVPYYRQINQGVRARLGGSHSARLVLYSVDFHDIEQLQHAGRWDDAGALLVQAARILQGAGADFIVLCTNTMHKVAAAIEQAVPVPLLHIVEPTAAAIRARGLRTVGLLGTRFTMEQDFYRGRLEALHGINVVVPGEAERAEVHRIIYEELCAGVIREPSRRSLRGIVDALVARGAEGVILGCTELGLLLGQADVTAPLFDTGALHAAAAVERCLAR
jgi:aspartate racemase